MRSSASVAVLGALAFAGSAYAQTADEAQDEARTVDEIVVTAQKREENLQNVPIVVTALPERLLQDAGVRDIKDLQVLTPGMNVTSTSNETNTTVRIRGVGTVGDNPGLESSVSVVIDGVYRPRNGVAFNDLGELERVEVLKGPQGTLFGKNTSAGVVNVVTKSPSFNFGANGELTVGNYGAIGGSAAVTGPIIEDKLAGRLFFARRTRDGLYDIKTGEGPRTLTEDADQDYWTARGQLLYAPTNDLDVRVIADYTKRDEHCCVGVQIVSGPAAAIIDALASDEGSAYPARPFDRVSYANRDTDQRIEEKGLSAEVTWDTPWLGGATLTSITAGRNWRTENGQDSDFTTADIVYRPADGSWSTEFQQFSQELRLAGRNDRIDWLVGAFYADEKLDQSTPFFYGADYEAYVGLALSGGANPLLVSQLSGLPFGTSFTPGSGILDLYKQTSKSLSFFTNDTVHLTDRLNLTLGLRHTSETKELNADYSNLAGNNGCGAILTRVSGAIVPNPGATALGILCLPWASPGFAAYSPPEQKREENEWTGTAKLAYDVTDDVMTYVSYARGYKSGGFNLDRARMGEGAAGLVTPNPDTSFPAEFVDSWELGAKTSWFDRTLSLNTALFHQKFEGFQLNAFTGTSYVVSSIPEVTSTGVDADLLWFTPVDGLTLQGGVTYAETEYGDFVPPAGVSARLPEARLSFAPLWSASLASSYERDLNSALKLRASLATKYSSSYNTGSDLAPEKTQEGFALVNGRIGVGDIDDRWTVELWGQNLFDQEHYQVAYDATLQTGSYDAFLGQPRMYGLTLRTRW
ncbi:MAG TPA: TonB-dependent receptor [Caulobacteraceae bacterium]